MKLAKLLTGLLLSAALAGCGTTPVTPVQAAAPTPIEQTARQINNLLSQIADLTGDPVSLRQIHQCRFELTSRWSNTEKDIYSAELKQRFSFTRDVRDIERIVAHTVRFKDSLQQWDAALKITFNRDLPDEFSHISMANLSEKTNRSANNEFTLVSLDKVPGLLVDPLEQGFVELARLCGNDVAAKKDIRQKLLGRWAYYRIEDYQGELVIEADRATVLQGDTVLASGPYLVEPSGDHHLLTIQNPQSQSDYRLMVDLISSNYARLLLAGNNDAPLPFARYGQGDNSGFNDNQLKLFRLGDLR